MVRISFQRIAKASGAVMTSRIPEGIRIQSDSP
jgi:hypothetical protein